MVGLTEAISLLKVPLQDIRILTVGTSFELKHRSDELDQGGKWTWKDEIVDVMFRGQSHAAVKQAQLMLDTPEQQRVFRLDFPVPENTFELDQVDLRRMLPKIEYFARNHGPMVERLFLDHRAAPFTPIYQTATVEVKL